MISKVSLDEKLTRFDELFSPKTVARLNEYDVMVVKARGEFVWHKHDDTDDFFLVLEGHLIVDLRDQEIHLGPGDLLVVPKGVEHRPRAEEETHVLLIEPKGTPNTGDAEGATPAAREWI